MEISRRLLVAFGVVLLLILALGIALTVTLERIQRLEEELAVRTGEYERERHQSVKDARELQAKLESAQAQVTALESALERARADLIRERRSALVDGMGARQ